MAHRRLISWRERSRAVLSGALSGLLACLCAAQIAAAQDVPTDGWRDGQIARARMAFAPADSTGARRALVEIALPKGWRTYWRWPGVVGVPPHLDWAGSTNAGAVDALWPAPERVLSYGHVAYGYGDAVLLDLRVTPSAPDQPTELGLTLSLAICAEICVPERFTLIASSNTPPPRWAIAARPAMPENAKDHGVETVACELGDERVAARLSLPAALAGADIAPAPPQGAGFTDLAIRRPTPASVEIKAGLAWRDGATARAPGLDLALFPRDGDGFGEALLYTACAGAQIARE